jgi:hypothetical protein
MLSSEQLAFDHGNAADPGAQGHHDHVRTTSRCSSIRLAEQGHACIILDAKAQAKSASSPSREVNGFGVVVFSIGGQHSSGTRIDQPSKSYGDSGKVLEAERVAFDQLAKNCFDCREHGAEAPGLICVERFTRKNGLIFHQTTGRVCTPKIDR